MSLNGIQRVEELCWGEVLVLAEDWVNGHNQSRLAELAADWYTTPW